MKKLMVLLSMTLLSGSGAALAQQPAGPNQVSSPGSDPEFTVGLRRIGVLAGQSVICTPEATRPAEIDKVAEAGNMIANEFGLRAAFNFIGAAGFGSGDPFDKATCPAITKEWEDVQKKYGEQ